MKGYKEMSFTERLNAAAEARKATRQRALALPGIVEPAVTVQKSDREAIAPARKEHVAPRKTAKPAAEERKTIEPKERAVQERKKPAKKVARKAAAPGTKQKTARSARNTARKTPKSRPAS